MFALLRTTSPLGLYAGPLMQKSLQVGKVAASADTGVAMKPHLLGIQAAAIHIKAQEDYTQPGCVLREAESRLLSERQLEQARPGVCDFFANRFLIVAVERELEGAPEGVSYAQFNDAFVESYM